ncbi:MAG: PAS domain S-box protein [Deltaproteobacteria bacterium]|nr:PAS domain S-box protein [Kofleriaceae bacterium]
MTRRDLPELSKEELIRELEKLELAARRFAANAGEADRDRLIHDLHVQQVQLEMQNRELREAQERLEEVTSRYADLYDFAPVGYCTLDPEGRIQELNLTATAFFGAFRETLVGSPFASVAPLEDKRQFHVHLRRCLRENARVTSELTFSAGRRRGTRSVRIISDPVRDPEGATTAYRTILVDMSDMKALEHRLQLLSAAGEILASSLEYAAAVASAARIAVPALADICMIDMVSESGAVEREVVRFADPKKQAALAERMMHLAPRPGWQPPQASVIASGEPVLLAEVSAEQRERLAYDDRDAETLRVADMRSLMVVPLIARGRMLGALTLASAESDRRYSSLDLQVAQDLASRIATALDNARLYDHTQRANQALRLAEAKSSGIVSISADAIISIDRDQRITLFNEGAEKVFGYAKAEVIGAPLATLIPERLRAIHHQHVATFATGHEVARKMGDRGAVIVGRRKDGVEFPADAAISKLEVDGERILTVALRDVTEQKRVEWEQTFLAEVGKELASSLEYEDMLTRVVGLVVREIADFAVLYVVEEDGEIQRLRVASRDPSNAWFGELLGDLPGDRRRHHVGQVLEAQRPILMAPPAEMLAPLAQHDEHRRWLETIRSGSMIGVPLRVGDTCLGALCLLSVQPRAYEPRDLLVADEFGRRAALFLENARLHRAARRAIQARDDVLGVVAHDLRNPLGSILMHTELLRRHGPEPERRSRKPTDAIERAANRMNRLIQDLLDITRIEAGQLAMERAAVQAGKIVTEFVEAQKLLASSASLELRLDLPEDLGEVLADRDRLLQVLENLVGNAVKFTRPGGRVTIGAAPRGDEVLLWVADSGVGIDGGDVLHLFDRFWKARKAGRQGAGLGLAIVKGIVEAHGGRVWVESQVGVGSTFYFTLPLARPAPARPAVEAHRAAGIVLVVEDDPEVRTALRETLERAGYQVTTAANGADALAYLHREAPPFLIILDLSMPIMDGWAFLSERNRDPDLRSIPVIVVSGQRDVEDRIAAARASYVPKPIQARRLIETVAHVVH